MPERTLSRLKMRAEASPGVRYGFAVLAVAVALALRWALDEMFGERYAFLTFLPAIALVALVAGGRAAGLATVLSVVAADVFFIRPKGTLSFGQPADMLALGLFLSGGGLISAAGELLERARRREIEADARQRVAQAVRESEERLHRAQERLQFHLENSPAAVIEFDAEFRLVGWSRAACNIFGWEASEVLGKNGWEVPWVLAEDVEELKALTAALISGGQTRSTHLNRNVRKDGSVIWCQWFSSALKQPSGTLQSLFCLVLDVTERKQAEEALRESEERFRAMADGTPVIIWVHDAQANLQFINRAYCQFFGISKEQVLGAGWQPLVHPQDVAGYVDVFLECHRQRTRFAAQARVRVRGGHWRWIASYGEPRFSSLGEYLGIAGSSVDITEHKEFEAELERQVCERTTELQQTNEQLNTFCYSIAHDLKAPLRAQIAFARILEQDFGQALGEAGRAYVQRIGAAAERQSHLVSDLLSHMSLSRAELPLAPVDLASLVEQVRTDLALDIQQKQVLLEVGPLQGRVRANAASLHLVVLNLVSNAMKFVSRGTRPHVRVWAESRPDKRTVRLWVEDNGIGIAAQHRERVFGVFQRLHTTETYPGTGIGLAIVKKAVERMEGSVGVESQEGKGSRFWVELPTVEPTLQPAAADLEVFKH